MYLISDGYKSLCYWGFLIAEALILMLRECIWLDNVLGILQCRGGIFVFEVKGRKIVENREKKPFSINLDSSR